MGVYKRDPRLEVSDRTPPPNNLERNTKENKEKETKPERERKAPHSQKNKGELRSPFSFSKKQILALEGLVLLVLVQVIIYFKYLIIMAEETVVTNPAGENVVSLTETYVLKVKMVNVIANETKATITLTFDKAIPGYAESENSGYAKTEVNYVTFFRSRLTAQICDINDDVAFYRSCLGHGFSQKNASIVFMGAKLKLNRTFKAQGELREDGVTPFDRDCYVTDVIEIELCKRAKELMNAFILQQD